MGKYQREPSDSVIFINYALHNSYLNSYTSLHDEGNGNNQWLYCEREMEQEICVQQVITKENLEMALRSGKYEKQTRKASTAHTEEEAFSLNSNFSQTEDNL